MDLFFKAAAIALGGALFAIIVLLVGTDLLRAQQTWDALSNPPIVNDGDALSVRHTFIVEPSQFRQFAISVQGAHTVFLDNGIADLLVADPARFQDNNVNLMFFRHSDRVTEALPPNVSFYREKSYFDPRSTPILRDAVEEKYRLRAASENRVFDAGAVYPQNPEMGWPALSLDTVVAQYRRVVDITGTPGFAYHSIEDFVRNTELNGEIIRVRRFVRQDGSVVIYVDWWND
jgi:hypothetical protein